MALGPFFHISVELHACALDKYSKFDQSQRMTDPLYKKKWLIAHEMCVDTAQTQTHCNDVNVGLLCPQSLADGLLFVV